MFTSGQRKTKKFGKSYGTQDLNRLSLFEERLVLSGMCILASTPYLIFLTGPKAISLCVLVAQLSDSLQSIGL